MVATTPDTDTSKHGGAHEALTRPGDRGASAKAGASRRDWHCPECKRWMTLRQATRAMEHGCLAGCSGIDIEHRPEGEAAA